VFHLGNHIRDLRDNPADSLLGRLQASHLVSQRGSLLCSP
jgi:hypothetical protein